MAVARVTHIRRVFDDGVISSTDFTSSQDAIDANLFSAMGAQETGLTFTDDNTGNSSSSTGSSYLDIEVTDQLIVSNGSGFTYQQTVRTFLWGDSWASNDQSWSTEISPAATRALSDIAGSTAISSDRKMVNKIILLDPNDNKSGVPVPIISAVRIVSGGGYTYQETVRSFTNTIGSNRKQTPKRIINFDNDSQQTDDSQFVDMMVIDGFSRSGASGFTWQETVLSPNNVDYYQSSNVLNLPDDAVLGENGIDPPWMLDPLQRVVNITTREPEHFLVIGHNFQGSFTDHGFVGTTVPFAYGSTDGKNWQARPAPILPATKTTSTDYSAVQFRVFDANDPIITHLRSDAEIVSTDSDGKVTISIPLVDFPPYNTGPATVTVDTTIPALMGALAYGGGVWVANATQGNVPDSSFTGFTASTKLDWIPSITAPTFVEVANNGAFFGKPKNTKTGTFFIGTTGTDTDKVFSFTKNWSSSAIFGGSIASLTGGTFLNNRFFAFSALDSIASLYSSLDGQVWTPTGSFFPGQLFADTPDHVVGIAHNGQKLDKSLYVAVSIRELSGDDLGFYEFVDSISQDGISWSDPDVIDGGEGDGKTFNAVSPGLAFGNGRFVSSISEKLSGELFVSDSDGSDGDISWITVEIPGNLRVSSVLFSHSARAEGKKAGLFALICADNDNGSIQILTSSDGLDWNVAFVFGDENTVVTGAAIGKLAKLEQQ